MRFLINFAITCILVFVLGVAYRTSAALNPASPFCDHMVLQRHAPVPVWGNASGSSTITVSMNGQTKSAKSENGKWKVILDPMEAGGPYEMTISGDGSKTIKDVLIGEVWLASGQSNMHQGMWPSKRWDNIRHLIVSRTDAESPRTSVDCAWYVVEELQGWAQNTDPGFSKVALPFSIYLYQALGVPIGILSSSSGSSWVSEWMDPWALETAPAGGDRNPGSHFNGMINPLIPFRIRGAIWWQGEWDARNKRRGTHYHERFPWMIMGWRRLWNQDDFPLYFVQLQAHRSSNSSPQTVPGETRGYTIMRERMRQSLVCKNTGMVVCTDVAEGLHPGTLAKDTIGRRLCNWALAREYGKSDIVESGPLYKSMQIQDSDVTIRFDYTGGGLKLNEPVDLLHGFVVAGPDGIFHPAQARIEGGTVIISSSAVASPKVVRYAWLDAGSSEGSRIIKPVLVNGAGLPASLFSSDSEELQLPADQMVSLSHRYNVRPDKDQGAPLSNNTIRHVGGYAYDLLGRCNFGINRNRQKDCANGLYIMTTKLPFRMIEIVSEKP